MTVYTDLSTLFPSVEWTGGSTIHASFAREGAVAIPFKEQAVILYSLRKNDIGGRIHDMLVGMFPKFEWLLEREVFANLFLIDTSLQLRGLPTSVSPDRIQNPATKNLFHRCAILAPYVGAVRFWASKGGSTSTYIGFRFRIVKLLSDKDEIDVRAEAREREHTILLDMEVVEDTIMEVKEPPQKALDTVAELLCNFA